MTTVTAPVMPVPTHHLTLDTFEVAKKDGRRWVYDATPGSTTRYEVMGKNPEIVPDDLFGSALSLDGSDTAVDLGPIGKLIPGSANRQTALTVSLWVKLADGDQRDRALVTIDNGWSLELDDRRRPRFLAAGAGGAGATRQDMEEAVGRIGELEAAVQTARAEAARLGQEAANLEAAHTHATGQVDEMKQLLKAVPAFHRHFIRGNLDAVEALQKHTKAQRDATRSNAKAAKAKVKEAEEQLAKVMQLAGLTATAGGSPLAERQWTHVVAVFDGRSVALYVNGVESVRVETGAVATAIRHQASAHLLLGARSDGSGRLAGQLARFQQFDRALTAEEIQLVRETDQTSRAAFRGRYPFDFEFRDGDALDVLYISDTGVNTVDVTITNTSAAPLTLKSLPKGTMPSADAHHLELRFRPGTFRPRRATSPPVEVKKAPSQAWEVSDGPIPALDGVSSSIFLAFTGARSKVVAVGESLTVTLQYNSADGQLGSRGTNVVLGYRNVQTETSDLLGLDVGGERIRSVDIVSRSGRQVLPLHVGFHGSNRVLNRIAPHVDASDSTGELVVRMLNNRPIDPDLPEKDYLRFRSIKSSEGTTADRATKFTVSFDVDGDWALLSGKDQIDSVTLQWRQVRHTVAVDSTTNAKRVVHRPQAWKPASPSRLGNSATWTFNPDFDGLAPGDYIELRIAGIITTEKAGLSNVSIHYEDIPGYWDGHYVLAVEKSPLVFDGGRVGVARHPSSDGSGDMTVDLTVAGRIQSDSPNGGLWIQKRAFIGGFDVNKVGFWNNGSWRFTVDNAGQVGIGNTNPEYPLHIGSTPDVELQSGGALVIGRTNSTNLAFDDNEIMARNNGGRSTLYLNAPRSGEGGPVRVGQNLSVGGRLRVDNGVIQRGGNDITGTLDLGLYSQVARNWIRIVTSNAPIKFYTDGGYGTNPKLTITTGGNLTVAGFRLTLNEAAAETWTMERMGGALGFTYQGNHRAYISEANGEYRSLSDVRLKTDIEDVRDSLAIVGRLRPRRFRWIDGGSEGLGFVAQEVEAVVPGAVEEREDLKAVSYSQFIPLAIGAIQQQQEQIVRLQARLDAVESPDV